QGNLDVAAVVQLDEVVRIGGAGVAAAAVDLADDDRGPSRAVRLGRGQVGRNRLEGTDVRRARVGETALVGGQGDVGPGGGVRRRRRGTVGVGASLTPVMSRASLSIWTYRPRPRPVVSATVMLVAAASAIAPARVVRTTGAPASTAGLPDCSAIVWVGPP